jgi:hypothetical protein
MDAWSQGGLPKGSSGSGVAVGYTKFIVDKLSIGMCMLETSF